MARTDRERPRDGEQSQESGAVVVSNRVRVPGDHADVFLERLAESHGIEDQPGFRGLQVLAPVEGDEHVTMTYWDSLSDYEQWREGESYERAHGDRSAEDVFEAPNEVAVHEVAVERSPGG